MRNTPSLLRIVLVLGICVTALATASAQLPVCPARPQSGMLVQNPPDLYSQNGVLNLDLTLQNQQGSDGYMHYCYVYMNQGQQIEAPTLRLNPGDQLILNLTNNLQSPFDFYSPKTKVSTTDLHRMEMHRHVPMSMGSMHKPGTPDDPCNGT